MGVEIDHSTSQADLESQTLYKGRGDRIIERSKKIFRAIFPRRGMTEEEKRILKEDMTYLLGRPYDST